MHIISRHRVFVGLSCAFLRSMTVGGLTWTDVQLRESPKSTVEERRRGTDGRAKRRPQATWPSPLYRRPRRWRHFGAHLDLRLVSRNLARVPRPLRAVPRRCASTTRHDDVLTLRLTSAPTCCSGLRSWPRRVHGQMRHKLGCRLLAGSGASLNVWESVENEYRAPVVADDSCEPVCIPL